MIRWGMLNWQRIDNLYVPHNRSRTSIAGGRERICYRGKRGYVYTAEGKP